MKVFSIGYPLFINENFKMKKLLFLATTVFAFAILLFSCTDQGKEDARNQAIESVKIAPPPAPGTPAAAANTSGVKHYTCPNNCAGSGGDGAGTCPVCGTAYQHNQAFHGNTTITPDVTPNATPALTPTTPTPPTTEPAQNAAGVWHYTCSAGCAGGAGAAGTCASCGGALAHNQTYHQ